MTMKNNYKNLRNHLIGHHKCYDCGGFGEHLAGADSVTDYTVDCKECEATGFTKRDLELRDILFAISFTHININFWNRGKIVLFDMEKDKTIILNLILEPIKYSSKILQDLCDTLCK